MKEIDDILAGGLTAEDEDDVLKELDQIIQVIYLFIYYIIICLIILFDHSIVFDYLLNYSFDYDYLFI